MANYISSTRTNYFHVTDEDKFRSIIDRCFAEDNIEVWSERDENNHTVFGFGVYGTFYGIMEDQNGDYNEDIETSDAFDKFVEKLQEIIEPNDACIIYNAGWEKLRYVGADATIITKTDVATTNLTDAATNLARKALDNPNWNTQSDY